MRREGRGEGRVGEEGGKRGKGGRKRDGTVERRRGKGWEGGELN